MLKKTAMTAVAALFAAITLSAQPNNNSGNKEAFTPDKNTPIVLPAPNHQNNAEADTAKPNSDPPAPHTPLPDPNWVLVIVGVVTCGVIGWQSWETRKAAQATRDSVRLQEKAMEQWIEVINWKSSVFQMYPGEGGLLSIQVDIVNPTKFPVKVIGGSMLFINPAGFKETLDFPKISLTPGVPFESGVAVEITEQQVENYPTEPIFLAVAGAWSHIGALEKPTSQALGGSLYCAKDSTVFTPTLHMNPIKAATQEQNPN